MNSATIRARAVHVCALPKKSDARAAPEELQLGQRRVARALDRDHRFPGVDRLNLRLPDVAALSSRRSEKGFGERTSESSFPKRRRQRPDRRADLTLGDAAPAQGGIFEDDPDRRAKHCPPERAEAQPGRGRCPAGFEQALRQMKWNSRSRCALVCLGFTALFSIFSFRLDYLQMNKHDEYAGLAAEKHVYKQPISAERGSILDANDEVLAHNTPVETVVADASHLNNRGATIPLLRDALQLPADELEEKLGTDRRYIVLKREVPMATATGLREKLRAANLRGIYFERDTTRIYPNGSMLCHVIGFTDFEHHGIQGVEASMEEYLHGQDGYRFIEHNRAGQEMVLYRGQERAPRDGYRVHLTVDLNLQNIVENEIDAAVREYHPQKATIILMRPQTGEILAMANRPNYDLNLRSEAKPEEMKNRAIIDMMEPGSTFKIVTAAAALNEHKVRPDTTIFCENGIWNFGGRPLHDHKAYSDLSVQDILVKSSNIGAAKLALSVGDQKFYEYIRRFGFGERTGIELPGEINGLIRPPKSWSKISITRIPMGHEIGVTPLQMTAAMASIPD